MKNYHPADGNIGLPYQFAPFFTEEEMKAEEKPVCSDRIDFLFAVIYLFVGYGFINIGTYAFQVPRNFALFTLFYAVVVSSYMAVKKRKQSKESWFWLAVLLLMGGFYAFWSVMPLLQMAVVIVTAAYWTLSASGRLMDKNRTSSWFIFDLLNALAAVPFRNFFCHSKIILCLNHHPHNATDNTRPKYKTLLYVALGVLISIPVLLIILPLLASADEGFARLLAGSGLFIQERFIIILTKLLFSIPVTIYLYGLVYGGIHGRNTDNFSIAGLRRTGHTLHVVPDIAVYSSFAVICLTYIIFIVLQGTYLFSAFAGIRPEAFTYAEYARRGFFELCQIAFLNLGILLSAHFFSKTEPGKNKILRVLNIVLSILTLLLIATAISKMLMYIQVLGLTVKRILTMVFMLWLLITYVLIILRQKKAFALSRISILCGAVLFCLLCVIPVERCIYMYNLWAGK